MGLEIVALTGLLILSLFLQLWQIRSSRVPTTSDQAIVGLMAKHILEGKGHPVFYYGAAYAGSLEAHYLAGLFALFGPSLETYRLAMVLLVLATMAAVYGLARICFGRVAALAAAAYLAVPPFFFLYKGLTSDGHYNTFNLVTAAELAAAWIVHRQWESSRPAAAGLFLLGLAAGLGLWANPVTPFVSAGVLAWLALHHRLRVLTKSPPLLLGAIAGSFPWWFWNLRHDWASLKAGELARAGAEGWLRNLGDVLTRTFPTLVGGMQPTPNPIYAQSTFPASRELALALLMLLLIALLAKWRKTLPARGLFLLPLALLAAASAASGRFVFSEPRFLFPFYVLVPPLVGAAISTPRARPWAVLTALAFASALVLNAASLRASPIYDDIRQGEVTGSLEPLRSSLQRLKIRTAYTDYWTAYRLSFETAERVIATPIPGDDPVRYVPYVEVVGSDPEAAVILLEPRSRCLRAFLEEGQHRFRRQPVGAFNVFFGLDTAVLDHLRRGLGLPLPREAYRSAWLSDETPASLRAGEQLLVRVRVRNAGPCIWPVSVHLSYHWWPATEGVPPVFEGARGFLPGPLNPQESATITVPLIAPDRPGPYRLEYDLVHENVVWFADRGHATLSHEVVVAPR